MIADASFGNTAEIKAMTTELNNLMENNVFEELDDVGQDSIQTKWDFTEKSDGKETWIKARLVAKATKKTLWRSGPIHRHVKNNFCAVLALSATNHWKIKSVDIKSAFLQGRPIEREVTVKPPREAGTAKL